MPSSSDRSSTREGIASTFVQLFPLPRDWHNHNVRSVSRTFGEEERMSHGKTAIVTESQQGIGAGLVEGFLKRGYCVVA